MPGLILDTSANILCPHVGRISYVTLNTRVFINGQPAVTQGDTFLISGCVFNVTSSPHPCILVKWLSASLRIKINGQPVILSNSSGICVSADQSPQGPPNII